MYNLLPSEKSNQPNPNAPIASHRNIFLHRILMINLDKERTSTEMSIVHCEVNDRGEEKNLGIAEAAGSDFPTTEKIKNKLQSLKKKRHTNESRPDSGSNAWLADTPDIRYGYAGQLRSMRNQVRGIQCMEE
jgi:hypothetical protein